MQFPMTIARRGFCRSATAALFAGLTTRRAAAAPDLGPVVWQLGWLATVQFAGSYIAASRGYYRALGIDVDIRPGGPNVAVMPLIVAGRALVGDSTVSAAAQARLAGAPITIVGARWQQSPEVLLSPAARPLRTPAELVGKRLGVPSSDLVDTYGFLKANGIDPAQVHFVPVEDDPSPLVAGEIDAYFGYSTDEAITLQVRGFAAHALRFADFGSSGLFQVYVVHEASLRDPAARARIAAFLQAERRGWHDALHDPDLGVALALKQYGASLGLDPRQEALQSRATNALITSSDTPAHGLFWMSDEKIARTIAVLRREGMAASANGLFDNSVLVELNQTAGTVSDAASVRARARA
jgi:ABC-type nitrate/sulfonate/bicarbonate transport system substrate-binding protein